MATRVINPEQPKVGMKRKKSCGHCESRRVIRRTGNFLPVAPAVEAKPQNHPIKRSFIDELWQNAQAAYEKYKQLGFYVNKESKSIINPQKSVKNVACGVTKKQIDQIVDIDAADMDDELAAVEYIEDIYNYYKLTENDGHVHHYMGSQTEIDDRMRAVLVDWLIDVHNRFELMPESLYLTISIIDRFLSVTLISRSVLQLVGISSMLIACKYEELLAPQVSDLTELLDDRSAREEAVLLMEKKILGNLEWYFTVPTPYVFLVRYIKASIPADKEMENLTFFYAELGLMNYTTVINYSPSLLSASAVYAARCTLVKSPLWTETLKYHTGYCEDQLVKCAKLLVGYHSNVAENKLKAISDKYSNPERGAVALLPPASNLIPGCCCSPSSCK